MSLTECYQNVTKSANVALPQKSVCEQPTSHPRLLTIFTSFSSLPSDVFFYRRNISFDCSFSTGNNTNKIRGGGENSRCSPPLPPITFLSIPHSTGIKILIGMSKCFFVFFASSHGVDMESVGGLLYLMSAICIRWKISLRLFLLLTRLLPPLHVCNFL